MKIRDHRCRISTLDSSEEKCSALGTNHLVYRLAYNGDVVAFKMGRRPIFNATLRAAAGWLCFRPATAGLGPYGSRYGRFARALKNSQLTRRPPGNVTIICEAVH